MAKVPLKAGAEIDFLTRDELREEIDRFRTQFRGLAERKRVPTGLVLNAAGNTVDAQGSLAAVNVYVVEVGFIFRLHRVVFELAGYTLGVPYTKSTGYYMICREGRYVDGQPLSAPGFPQTWTAGSADGIEYRSGEQVQILVSTADGALSGTNLRIELEGTLNPLESLADG